MSSSRGVATVRMALLSLVFALLATSLMQPVTAGTPEAPEVQDAVGDIAYNNGTLFVPGVTQAGTFTGIDIVRGFFAVNGTNLTLTVTFAAAPYADAHYTARFNVNNTLANGTNTSTAYSLQRSGSAVTTANATASAAGNNLTFSIPLEAINATTGSTLTGLIINTTRVTIGLLPPPLTQDDQTGTDTAGPGLNFTVVTAPAVNPDDTDGDGLNDTCEMRWFNSTTATNNSSADPDNDTLTNGQECALGTDPTNADSDGDGIRDDQDPTPTGGTNGNNTNGTNTTTNTTTSQSNTTTSRTNTTTTGDAGAGNGTDDGPANFQEAVDILKEEVTYFGGSAAALVAVLVLCILALAVRWSL